MDGVSRRKKRFDRAALPRGAYFPVCRGLPPLAPVKVAQRFMEQSGLAPQQPRGARRITLHILGTLPRDEISFQASAAELRPRSGGLGILDLQERSQTRLFVRRGTFTAGSSPAPGLAFLGIVAIFTGNRKKIQRSSNAHSRRDRVDFAVQVSESSLARVTES